MELMIMIDMQKDFTTGVLGNKETAAVVSAVCNEITRYSESGMPLVYTMDTHYENYSETQEGRKLPVPHCIEGTEGWELPEEIKEAIEGMETVMVKKNTFGAKNLPEIVSGINEKTPLTKITLMGVCTDICVISNAMLLKAFFPETEICIKADCCAGVTPESAENALNAMKSCQITIE